MSIKLELEGREALRHTNAVHLLVTLGYTFDGFSWIAPVPTEQKQVVFQAPPKTSLNEQADSLLEEVMQSMRDSKVFEDLRAEQQSRQTAEQQLQKAVTDLVQRVNRIEDGAQFAFARGKGYTEFQRLLEQAITKGMEKATQPGGVLFTALKK